jgi:hypothetical protein
MDLNVLAIRDNRNSRAERQPSGKVRLKAVKLSHSHCSLQKARDSRRIKQKLRNPASVTRSRRGQRRRYVVCHGGEKRHEPASMKEGTMAAASGAFFTWRTACYEHAHAT